MTEPDTTALPGLRGLTVVEVSRFVEGAYCARLLADAGADVIKIEPPGGDVNSTTGAVPGRNS